MGANRLVLSDAEVNLLEAEHSLLAAQFVLSRISTIAALGPVVAEEEGLVGLVGPKTEMLRESTNTKLFQLQQRDRQPMKHGVLTNGSKRPLRHAALSRQFKGKVKTTHDYETISTRLDYRRCEQGGC